MKNFLAKTLYLGIIFYIAGLAGCAVPLEPREEAAIPQGTGRVVVSIGGGPERTILPAAEEFDKITRYTLTFDGPEAVKGRELTKGGSVSIDLPSGSWTISATGWGAIEGPELAIARGSAQVVLAGGASEAATIMPAPVTGGGNGTFSYSMNLPANPDEGDNFTISTAEGEIVETVNMDSRSFTGTKSLPPGEYVARIRLRRGADYKYVGVTEVFHIYSGLTTALSKQFTSADYTETVTDFDLTSRITAPAAWSAPVRSFSKSAQYASATSSPNGSTVTWQLSDGTPVSTLDGTIFAPDTVYRVVVNLKIDGSWTFEGVPENVFTHDGASMVANSANSGMVTITFPATDSPVASIIEIDTAEKLAKIGNDDAYPLNRKYKLTANLTLSDWTPIGNNTAPFRGAFDGNGKTITVESFSSSGTLRGIFGCVMGASAESRAVAKDLQIVSSSVNNTSGAAVGLLAAYAENVEISGITLSGSLTHTADTCVAAGGIVGDLRGGNILKDCSGNLNLIVEGTGTSSATLFGIIAVGNTCVGGFVGHVFDDVDIIDCSNTGDVTGTGALVIYCSGIVGNCNSNSQSNIEGCSSAGSISASTSGSTYAYAGGIAGEVARTSITGCHAEGAVSANAEWRIGGIAGAGGINSTIAQSYFNGTVTGISTGSGNPLAGGIVGSFTGSRIEDCWSHGTVTGHNNAGGIVGKNGNSSASNVLHCYSTATVIRTGSANTTNPGVGGIAGTNSSTVTKSLDSCVALNPSISSAGGTVIHRVVGFNTNGTPATRLSDNYSWTGMTIDAGSGSYTPAKGADQLDGADVAAEELTQAFYEGLDWDFGEVWEMDAYGYPKLQWQAAPINRTPLTSL
jgi:hypothetical protein